MTIVKSFATGLGDTYYIRHNSDNFTIIDCHIPVDRDDIIEEIEEESRGKGITRFISTHPDNDHIKGLVRLDDALGLLNFYVVKNRATKPDYTADFERYCELRDSDKAFFIEQGCSRRWMNESSDERGSSGISILWPDLDNSDFKNVLTSAEDGGSPNNLSTIVKYSLNNGVTMLWLGDLETDFMETIEDEIELPKADVVFAAHHGRARMPAAWIDQMDPQIIVLGEAPREYLEYYGGRDHLRQNTAWDITFENESGRTDVYVGNPEYEVPYLRDEGFGDTTHGYYMGSFDTA
ncbi:MAG TPA: MBL fold metallo-hydrolase [Solirubrobacterales bacterium]|nr:MBL fold metallo-hydrolase [Solirubrobacterales bacterium]